MMEKVKIEILEAVDRKKTELLPEKGKEGCTVEARSYSGCSLAVLTSGGDSQGMNSAVRAIVRMGIYLGAKVYTISDGYKGLISGGENIKLATWENVSDIIQRGGTILGSARCKEFMEREGRLTACLHLLEHDINNLIVIGGDGSLSGAHLFRQEWPGYLKQLISEGKISRDKQESRPTINIVGLVGSIDNDFCGTDMTIGTDSALHRITDAVDAVISTAQSHQRCFVIEVMGRHCGYLALVGAVATEADWVFIPEWPPANDWPDLLCNKLAAMRAQGQRTNIIVIAEGAIDREGKSITADQVKQIITDRLHYDTRVTILGHVQRGGMPSAYDRLLGCRMGAEAVLALMDMGPKSEACVVSIDSNVIVRVPLMVCVERTHMAQKAIEEGQWEMAVKLRGISFQRNLAIYQLFAKIGAKIKLKSHDFISFFETESDCHKNMSDIASFDDDSQNNLYKLAVMHVGAPACGMNAASRAFVRMCLHKNCTVVGIQESFAGLARGSLIPLRWTDVIGWTTAGGSYLGTQKQLPNQGTLTKMAATLEREHINGLMIIGGFEAFYGALMMFDERHRLAAFNIPIIVIPCTISNNVPGTYFSLGSDTALNEICFAIDKIKQSATGTKKRVFIIETMGGKCGYLATLSALASGADNAYIFEEDFNVDDVIEDVRVITEKMKSNVQRYVVIRNELANPNYTTEFIRQLFSEEGKGAFSTRANVLGHLQQGGTPSPFDRNQSIKMGALAAQRIISELDQSGIASIGQNKPPMHSATLLGQFERQMKFTNLEELRNEADFANRLPVTQWWLKLRPLLRILARHLNTDYQKSAVDMQLRGVQSYHLFPGSRHPSRDRLADVLVDDVIDGGSE